MQCFYFCLSCALYRPLQVSKILYMLFLLSTLLNSHMNPLIPVPFHDKSSTSLYLHEYDMLCFYCAEVVGKVKQHHMFSSTVSTSALQQ